MRLTTRAINTYFAMLVVAIVASGATLIIVHVATADTTATALGNEVQYAPLQKSILGN